MTRDSRATHRRAHFRGHAFLPLLALVLAGCSAFQEKEPKYGREATITLSTARTQIWAIAPAINISGQRDVDPLLQADLLYQQLQQVKGLTVVPVDRVVPVFVSLRLSRIESPEQATLVCDLLGCDGLIIPTITTYDAYNPPKMAAALQLFTKPSNYTRPTNIDPRALARAAQPVNTAAPIAQPNFIQVVGMFDAANGTTHAELMEYANGRYDPKGAYKQKEYLVSMDRYAGFVYRKLIEGVLSQQFQRVAPPQPAGSQNASQTQNASKSAPPADDTYVPVGASTAVGNGG